MLGRLPNKGLLYTLPEEGQRNRSATLPAHGTRAVVVVCRRDGGAAATNLSFAGQLKTEMNSAELYTTLFVTLMNIESYFLLMLEL